MKNNKPFGLFEVTGTFHKMSGREQGIVMRKMGAKFKTTNNDTKRQIS